ncbi:MAG: ParA family partition ATPase [Methylococcales bacterium]
MTISLIAINFNKIINININININIINNNMKAKIISLSNQKGGVGKTTLSMQIAGALSRSNKVLIADIDPQGSAVTWSSSASDESPFPAHVIGLNAAKGKVHNEIRKYVDDYDFIIIDCPPSINSTETQSALLISDLALIPILPSPPDIWASVGIVQIIENAKTVNENLQARLVLNQKQANRTLATESLAILENFQIPLAKTTLTQREIYRQCAAFGGTVFDFGKREAAIQEIESLCQEIEDLLR